MMEKGTMMVGYQPLGNLPNFFRIVLTNPAVSTEDIDFFLDEIVMLGEAQWLTLNVSLNVFHRMTMTALRACCTVVYKSVLNSCIIILLTLFYLTTHDLPLPCVVHGCWDYQHRVTSLESWTNCDCPPSIWFFASPFRQSVYTIVMRQLLLHLMVQ